MESVSKLSHVLELCVPSLTDLDLSFSYVGQNGASSLRQILASSACQLVRVGLCGNNLGDAGITELSRGLGKNKTLTYLDVRTNQVTPPGLRALCHALSGGSISQDSSSSGSGGSGSSGSSRGTANAILSTVDLGGNILTQADLSGAERGLRDWGSSVQLKCLAEYPGHNDTGIGALNRANMFRNVLTIPKPIGSFLLYQQPTKITTYFNSSPIAYAPVYKVDLRCANTHYAFHAEHPLV